MNFPRNPSSAQLPEHARRYLLYIVISNFNYKVSREEMVYRALDESHIIRKHMDVLTFLQNANCHQLELELQTQT